MRTKTPNRPAVAGPLDGAKLAALRAARGQTQQAVADATGLSQPRYALLERSGGEVYLSAALRLARHFGVPVEAICRG